MNIKPTHLLHIIPATVFATICIWLRVVYKLPLADSILWGLATWVFYYLPGKLVLDFVGGHSSGIRGQIHSFALGSALIVPIYSLFRTLHWEAALMPIGVFFVMWWVLTQYQLRKFHSRHEDVGLNDLSAFAVLIIILLFVLHFSFFTDTILTSSGFETRFNINETFQHLGLVNVLTHTYPPFYPFVSGLDFSHYHLYMHLQIEMIHRVTGVDTLLLTFFMMPMMYLFLILWLPYAFISRWLGSRVLGVVAGTMMFCTNLAWIPGIIAKVSNEWETLLAPTVFSLVTLNGYTPSIYVFLLALFAMRDYFESGSRRNLVLFAILAYVSYGFKSTMGLQLLVLSVITGLFCLFFCDKKKRGRDFALASGIALAVLAINLLLVRKGIGNTVISIAPLGEYRLFLEKFGAHSISTAWFIFWLPVYFLLMFGARGVGLLITQTVMRRNFDPVLMLLVLFSICGVALVEMVMIVSPGSAKNASTSFSGQSLAVSWLLLPILLARYVESPKKLWLALILIFAVSLPTSIQLYRVKYKSDYTNIGRDESALVSIIKKTDPDAVFLFPLRMAPSCAGHLGGRQCVFDGFYSFAKDWAGKEEAERRMDNVKKFFGSSHGWGSIKRGQMLRRYRVNYVYAPLPYKDILDGDPMLSIEYLNSSYVMYRVSL